MCVCVCVCVQYNHKKPCTCILKRIQNAGKGFMPYIVFYSCLWFTLHLMHEKVLPKYCFGVKLFVDKPWLRKSIYKHELHIIEALKLFNISSASSLSAIVTCISFRSVPVGILSWVLLFRNKFWLIFICFWWSANIYVSLVLFAAIIDCKDWPWHIWSCLTVSNRLWSWVQNSKYYSKIYFKFPVNSNKRKYS